MALILPGIHSLAQHLQHLQALPEDYRPQRCPHCGRARMWCHGAYTRKADRERSRAASLNPVPIPRFLCSFCYRTCSRLPECVPPRRWYLWAVQQAMLWLICAGHPLARVSEEGPPSERTVARWWRRLRGCLPEHRLHLCNRVPELGRESGEARSFWKACLKRMKLSSAMLMLTGAGLAVP